jgi:hypothetical protein
MTEVKLQREPCDAKEVPPLTFWSSSLHLWSASLMRDQKSQPIVATATVTNTGKRRATEIVQCYVNIRGGSTGQPVRKEVLDGQPATSVIEMEDFTSGVEQSTNLEIDEVVVLPTV